ncbi:MAG: AhpC/TSA family protein, partial [Bacteroidales bacterium]|nr:AhpC/TSA family protein [Bacteroidales bacterium]
HACNQTSDGYTIQVNLEGSEGKLVKLMTQVDRKYVLVDSVLVEPGVASIMSNSVDGVQTMYLDVEGGQGSILMLIENADYTISGTMDDPVIDTNGKAQSDLNEYNATVKPMADKLANMRGALQEAFSGDDEELKESLRNEYYALYEKQDATDAAYVSDHPASFATVLALRGTFYNLDAEQLEATLEDLDPSLHQMEEYKYMHGKMERMKAVAVGQAYADFGLETPEDGTLNVSDVHSGNVLLIDFWASWCGPCRRENPELVEIYHEFHERGFEILGVSLDRNKASWIQAIADDDLTWPQISDLKYWKSAGAELYGVPAIPHAVLIDRNGIITAKKLNGDELREAIESLL